MKPIAYVVRHGETESNAQKLFRGWSDASLDYNGIVESKQAAEFMKDKQVKEVICSPLLRAFSTACIVASQCGLPVKQTRGLFGWNLGIFTGISRDENYAAMQLFVRNPQIKIPCGESLEAFEQRQFTFWKVALDESKLRLTCFVTHSSAMTALLKFTQNTEVHPLTCEIVKPGGVLAVYKDGNNHCIEPVFGLTRPAKFGS